MSNEEDHHHAPVDDVDADEDDEAKLEDEGDWGDDDPGADWGNDDDWDDEDEAAGDWGTSTAAGPPSGAPVLKRQVSYVVLDEAFLAKRMDEVVAKTRELLFVSATEASCLLRHYGWDDKTTEAAWFEDQLKVRRKCGVTAAPETPFATRGDCSSAFCDEDVEGMALNCGHFFCHECWNDFLVSQIRNGRPCVFATCPGMACQDPKCTHKFGCACNEMVPINVFERYVQDEELMTKYHRWILGSFVEGQHNIRWCPRPNCERAVEYPAGGSRTVECGCGHRFCFSCAETDHNPAPCDIVRKWNEKEKSDDATEIWLAARTKTCPGVGCGVRIEKNKACNHMKCAKCGHDFCWLCKGPWSEHGSSTGGYYVCNKYNENVKQGKLSTEEQKMQDSQLLLQKYTYYYKRFKGSQQGIELTTKLWKRIEANINDEDFARYTYLSDAIEKLVEARRVLMWTYCMDYYLKTGKEKQLFEYQQELLVNQTETLQDILETHEKDLEELDNQRKRVLDLTGTVEKFRREMCKGVENGEFEALLLAHADEGMEKWGCSFCTTDNKPDVDVCASCGACRKHGEQECKACRKN